MEGVFETTENELGVTEEAVTSDPVVEAPEETNQEVSTNEPLKNESARETVARVLKDQKANVKSKGDQGPQDNPEGLLTKPEVAEQETTEQELPTEDPEDYTPPNRLSGKEKALFNKLPKAFKPAVARMFKDHQALVHRTNTELSERMQESKHIVESVRPYYVSHPELASNGVTESAFISALVGAHMELTNPKTDKAKIAAIAKDRGYNIRFVNDEGEEIDEGRSAPSDISSHPQFRALQEQQNQINSFIQDQRISSVVAPIENEWKSIREEKAMDGQYRYPRMHDSDFWESAKPLISALTNSGTPHGEALKKAYVALEGPPHGQVAARGLPANNNNNRALSAASSVRGRSAPPSSGFEMPLDKIPSSARDTVRMVLAQQRRGG